MTYKDPLSKHFSALNWARETYSAICEDAAKFHITSANGESQDVTGDVREHYKYIIEMLEGLQIEDRRKHPRG